MQTDQLPQEAPSKQKPKLSQPEKTQPVEDKAEAVDTVVRDAATIRRDDFVAKVLAQRNAVEPDPVVPKRTERQASQLELEMAAGRRRTEHFAEQEKLRVAPPRDLSEGTSVPVYRPKGGEGTKDRTPARMRNG